MKRLAALLILLLVAGCQQAASPPRVATPAACRMAPEAYPVAADRGSGGTGGIADRGSGGTGRTADRGSGGTGQPALAPAMTDRGSGGTGAEADRGSGGTGIVGIVTGFGSICVDGLEVPLDPVAPVVIDGTPGGQGDLRVGQVVAISATGPEGRLQARSVAVRHEVSGPIEAVLSADPTAIMVAGQIVRVPNSTLGSAQLRPGAWVAVSGLRDADGTVVASRIDPRQPGAVQVHGPLLEVEGQPWIGDLPLRTGHDPQALAGTYVFVEGTYADGVLSPDAVLPDTLLSNPPAWFGPGTTRLMLAGHARFAADRATLGGGYQASLGSGVAAPGDTNDIVVLRLQRSVDGSFAVIGIQSVRPPGAAGSLGGGTGTRPRNAAPGPTGEAPGPAAQSQAAGAERPTAAGAASPAGPNDPPEAGSDEAAGSAAGPAAPADPGPVPVRPAAAAGLSHPRVDPAAVGAAPVFASGSAIATGAGDAGRSIATGGGVRGMGAEAGGLRAGAGGFHAPGAGFGHPALGGAFHPGGSGGAIRLLPGIAPHGHGGRPFH